VLWGLMIWGSQKFARYYQENRQKRASDNEASESKECAA
jgi:phospholipase D1/2